MASTVYETEICFADSSVYPWIYFYRQANYRRALKLLLGYKANKTTPMQRKPVVQGMKSTKHGPER